MASMILMSTIVAGITQISIELGVINLCIHNTGKSMLYFAGFATLKERNE